MDLAALYLLNEFSDNESDDENESDSNPNQPLFVQRKMLRSNSSPLDLAETEFINLFRLSKEAFKYVLDELTPHCRHNQTCTAIPPILKLAATLRLLAQGSYQLAVGQDYLIGMAQPTVSVAVSQVLTILEQYLCAKHIRFDMTTEEKKEAKRHFLVATGFPGVIGCVDGTHVKIIRPVIGEERFYSRKGFHSNNAMVVCNHKMEVIAVNAAYGGASHDSFVWSLSAERESLKGNRDSGDKTSWLLGDSGYALEPWMMTPYRSAEYYSTEANYNTTHSKCRNIIERCFGVFKGRFRCLLQAREPHYTPEKAAQIINVCCMLHNVCIKYKICFHHELTTNDEDDSSLRNVFTNELMGTNLLAEAKKIREHIKNTI